MGDICARRPLRRLLSYLAIVMIAVTLLVPARSYSALTGAARKARKGPRVRAAPASWQEDPTGPGGLVYVALGDPHYQFYLLESIRQARLFNPTLDIYAVIEPQWFYGEEGRKAGGGAWLSSFAEHNVRVVNYTTLTDPFVHEFRRHYEFLWDQLGRRLGSMMLPTVNGRMNAGFTMATMERLVAVHQLMALYRLTNVVHVENDQMLYGPVEHVVRAAQGCGVDLAMTRIGVRLAPAVVFASGAPALKSLLDFIYGAISQGVDHAIDAAGDKWVTDMSLTAAYFRRHVRLDADGTGASLTAAQNVTYFPMFADASSCLYRKTGLIYDGAGLGTWCCGSFEFPGERYSVRLAESQIPYWDLPFEWVGAPAAEPLVGTVAGELLASGSAGAARTGAAAGSLGRGRAAAAAPLRPPGGEPLPDVFRMPRWNGSAVFNLHMHSKQLHEWRSTDETAGLRRVGAGG